MIHSPSVAMLAGLAALGFATAGPATGSGSSPTAAVSKPPSGRAVDPDPSLACGWPDRVQARIMNQATDLMPSTLRRFLKKYDHALMDGARQARAQGQADRLAHFQGPLREEGTAAALAMSLARITALMDSHRPMREVVHEMGIASHLVTDLSNPFRGAPADTVAMVYSGRFREYVGDKLKYLRVVFEGYDHPLLTQEDVPAFGRSLADRSRSYLDDVIGAYRRFDSSDDPAALDERSIAFGVASLSYSRSVTDTARAWLHAWRRAHGDLTGLPFPLEGPEPDAADTSSAAPSKEAGS